MIWHRYRQAITISFVFFPPTVVWMMVVTGDKGLQMFLILYLLFVFFFLHKVKHIIFTGIWVFLCFACLEFGIQYQWPIMKSYAFVEDKVLYALNYTSALVFIFLTAYMIKFQVWKFEKSIREKKDELRKLNQLKDKIFSVISHDLRAPIASLITFVQSFEEHEYTEQELKTYLPVLKGNLEQTADLLNNLLFWSRSQINNMELNVEKTSVYDLTSKTVRCMSNQASEKSILLVNEVPVNCYAYVDESTSEIVLRNLLANAIKFSDSGGTVIVSAVEESGFVQLKVADNGVGIHPEKQNLIFSDRYYTTPGTLKEKGTGLGLMICRDLASKIGGKLDFISQYKKGTEFTFSMPKSRVTCA